MFAKKSFLMRKFVFVLVVLSLFGFNGRLFAQQQNQQHLGGGDLFEMPLEDLMDLEITVTSSARRPQMLARTGSAMYVITAEDIRQAGATKLGDIFRLVPGMDVAQKRGEQFAVSPRGFAITASRRTLVLLDGRPLYEPYGGGLDFQYLPVFLDNIERIEVIRGAAGVMWGVNAVNGVINIITKKAADTQGGLAYGGFGNRALQQGYMRLGGMNGPLYWRGTTGAFHDNGLGTDGGDAYKDFTQQFIATGRADLNLADDTKLIFSGGHSGNSVGSSAGIRRYNYQHMNLALEKKLSKNSFLAVRWFETFYDRVVPVKQHRRTREDMIELEHGFVRDAHNIVWGADYIRDTMHLSPIAPFTDVTDPDSFANDQASIFIQDEITLADNLWFTVGYRLHHNEISHGDWAGLTAMVWEIKPKHFVRGAVSKSFRRPTLMEELTDEKGGKNKMHGNTGLGNERLISYELGYRGLLRENLELNVEGFMNKHSNLIGQTGSKKDSYFNNVYDVTTYGVETAINWRPYNWWLIRANHTYEHQTDEAELSDLTHGRITVYTVPHNKVGLTNRFYLDDSTTINTQLFWYDSYYNPTAGKVDPFFRFDLRLAKRFWNDTAEIAFGATNLTEHLHNEGAGEGADIARLIYVQFFYKF